MTVKDLKWQVLDFQKKEIPYDIFVSGRKAGWFISSEAETTELFKVVKDHKRRMIFFVTDLDTSKNKGFLARLRKINRLTLGTILSWADSSSKEDDYEIFVAFKYELKYDDMYDYGAAGDLKGEYKKDLSRFILSPKEKTLTKVRLHGLDECMGKMMEASNDGSTSTCRLLCK